LFQKLRGNRQRKIRYTRGTRESPEEERGRAKAQVSIFNIKNIKASSFYLKKSFYLKQIHSRFLELIIETSCVVACIFKSIALIITNQHNYFEKFTIASHIHVRHFRIGC